MATQPESLHGYYHGTYYAPRAGRVPDIKFTNKSYRWFYA